MLGGVKQTLDFLTFIRINLYLCVLTMVHDDIDNDEDAEDGAGAVLATFPRAEDAADTALESGAATPVEDILLRCEEDAPTPSDAAERSVQAASASLE